MTRKRAGVKLASVDGQHSAWTDPTLCAVGSGWGWAIDCHFGGVRIVHWLAPDPSGAPGSHTFADVVYAFPSVSAAQAALDAYRKQMEAE